VLTHVYFDTEIGRSIDVATDQRARLTLVSLGLDFRPAERIELETFAQTFRLHDLETKQWRVSEQTASLLGIGHISARDTLRVIAQYTLSKRNPLAYPFQVTPRTQTSALSLVYAHKRALGREFNMGVTRSTVNALGQNKEVTTEIFAKLSWAMSL
jgi:hypothetical protein